ncbi:MAG: hypothetical protein EHM93_02410 [Bacteroidales bacterium]|nr:MAG: hypothetical protein EHM93_02410 [Bacteroidales bacterium]
MKNIACRVLLLVACLGISGVSCSKSETDAGAPTIELVDGENLITNDTSAMEASTLHFRVHCKWNGEQTLTNFIVANNNVRVVDEGMNTNEFVRDVDFAKSGSEVDSIVFTIRDIESGSASKSIKVQKKAGSGGGELKWYANITLDAQNAVGGKGFLSFANGVTYTKQDAGSVSQNINLLYYYDNSSGEANVLSSPGANLSGIFDLSGWSVLNTTRFIKMSINQAQFEAITDPVYVVNAYSITGNRKAKNLVVGDTYSFKDESTGKYGIFRVNEAVGQDAGKVVITIVMQK